MCGLGSFMLQWSGMQTQPSTMTPTTCNLMHTWSTWAVLEASDPGFLSWYMLCVLSHLIIFHYSGNDVGLWSLCPILRNCLNALDCVGRSRYRGGVDETWRKSLWAHGKIGPLPFGLPVVETSSEHGILWSHTYVFRTACLQGVQ